MRFGLVVCLAVCLQLFPQAWGFIPSNNNAIMRSITRTQLSMGGGRSQAEKSMTTKQIFRELRGKLNEAAQAPGFFDVGQHVVRQLMRIGHNGWLE